MSKRSTRPRDRWGRPLDHADPLGIAFPPAPEIPDLSADLAWDLGIEYLDRDLPFHAHEIFEQRWKLSLSAEFSIDERVAWQVLAQWGAALTHLARGNPAGAERVAQRALARWQEITVIPPMMDQQRIVHSLTQLAAPGISDTSRL